MEKSWFDDYILNTNKVEVLIKYTVVLPVLVDNFNLDEHPLHTRQKGREIYVSFHKKISQRLFEDIRDMSKGFEKNSVPDILLKRNPSQYIVAYIKETLPKINEEITKRRYSEGHLILKTISLFDVSEVFLISSVEKEYYAILWPLPLPKFSFPIEYTKTPDVTYIRDFINAMTNFFYYELDDCIRQIITSLENYLKYYKLESFKNDIKYPQYIGKSKFKKSVYCHIQKKYYDNTKEEDLEVLRENVSLIYDKRCEIVHDELRLKFDNHFFCRKAIITLLKIYQSNLIKNDNKFDYIFSFYSQFEAILNLFTGLNLDELEKASNKILKPNKIKSSISDLKNDLYGSI
ncbi:MAG: hypothetical protein WA057_01130 [Candidatus Magasanikiibacteriota bacterium]